MVKISKAFYGTYAEFESPLCTAEALAKLRQLIRWELGKLELFGEVEAEVVDIQVLHTFNRSNGTRFEGILKERENSSILVGRFIASKFTRGTTALFLTMLAFSYAVGPISVLLDIATEQNNWADSLAHFAFLLLWMACVAGFALVIAGNGSAAREDVDELAAAICKALLITSNRDKGVTG